MVVTLVKEPKCPKRNLFAGGNVNVIYGKLHVAVFCKNTIVYWNKQLLRKIVYLDKHASWKAAARPAQSVN